MLESVTKLQKQEVFFCHIKGPPKRFTNYYVEGAPSFATLIETTNLLQEQKIYLEAITNPQWKDWQLAMEDEHKSLFHNHIWILINLRLGKNAILFVFHLKTNPNGEIARYKAWVVAKGSSQLYGIDHDGTISPVVQYDSIRIVLVIVIIEDFELTQFDIKIAYLYVNLKEEIYMC